MMQQTSLAAWEKTKLKIGAAQRAVLHTLKRLNELTLRGATDQEVAKALGWSINRVTPRRGELYKKGLVRQGENRQCSVTKGQAAEWWVL